MNTKNKRILRNALFLMLVAVMSGLGSCSKTQSYSELLREEEKAVNNYLAGQKIINNVPEDSISFITGTDAPFYRLDEDGYIYMQVINKGDLSQKVKAGDVVYFRYNRLDLKSEYLGSDPSWNGTQNQLTSSTNLNMSYKFVYKNQYLESSQYFGQGIQWPLKFLGYNSEVNLVLRSYYGFSDDQTSCIPYLINLKYYRAEY
ncbi:MAG: DUF4827 domain-containing protein [Muribaculaceae bacterium]|nr:DUF4827 domain-containing protein [Muribaculaceae bacterium]MDE6768379.1 DUF4827 domain-containing protein [Muribaculaceae bacterium]